MRRGLTPSRYYPDESEIADLILGPGRVCEWKALALVLERQGLPPVDKQIGARFWPAVETYFMSRHGLVKIPEGSLGPQDGEELCPQPRQRSRQASQLEPGATVHRLPTGRPDATS